MGYSLQPLEEIQLFYSSAYKAYGRGSGGGELRGPSDVVLVRGLKPPPPPFGPDIITISKKVYGCQNKLSYILNYQPIQQKFATVTKLLDTRSFWISS
jgi:hypothetical protein